MMCVRISWSSTEMYNLELQEGWMTHQRRHWRLHQQDCSISNIINHWQLHRLHYKYQLHQRLRQQLLRALDPWGY